MCTTCAVHTTFISGRLLFFDPTKMVAYFSGWTDVCGLVSYVQCVYHTHVTHMRLRWFHLCANQCPERQKKSPTQNIPVVSTLMKWWMCMCVCAYFNRPWIATRCHTTTKKIYRILRWIFIFVSFGPIQGWLIENDPVSKRYQLDPILSKTFGYV